MASRLVNQIMYRLGFIPCDGHPLATSLRALVEGNGRQADVTRLSSAGVDTGFALIVDNGCLHGMTDEHRDAYVREVTSVAATDARLLIIAFGLGGSRGVRGIRQAEIERRFSPAWTLLAAGDETAIHYNGNRPCHYLFERHAD